MRHWSTSHVEMIISRAKLTNFICEICVAGNFSHACDMRKSISHVKSTNYSWFNVLLRVIWSFILMHQCHFTLLHVLAKREHTNSHAST